MGRHKTKPDAQTIAETVMLLDQSDREILLMTAMQSLRPGTQRAQTSTIWKLDEAIIWQACRDNIIGDTSAAEIQRRLEPQLKQAKVSVQAVARFLPRVRAEYDRLCYGRMAERTRLEQMTLVEGDLMKAAGVLLTRLAASLAAWMDTCKFQDLSIGQQHAMLRGSEIVRDGAKVQAEHDYKVAQAERVRQKLLALKSEADSTGRKTVSMAEIVKIVDAAMGLDAGDDVRSAA